MTLSPAQWHARYTRQAGWTASLRSYLFERHGIAAARRVLDCGSGTGALEAGGGLGVGFQGWLVGLDIDSANLAYAKSLAPDAAWVQGDGLRLPFAAQSYDLVFCHFYLLWVADPLQALRELRRVTRPGGSVIALAEPDYGGRIDFPPELETLARWQQASLRRQGANPLLGRRLAWLFHQAGLEQVEFRNPGGAMERRCGGRCARIRVGGAAQRPGKHARRWRRTHLARRVRKVEAAG